MEFDFKKEPGKVAFNRKYVTDVEPLITVVTPYYNAHEYFEYLYPCVMNQSFPWFEWIVVNDGSTHEKSLEQLSSLEQRDRRIKVVSKENGGISSARNRGIQESTTDIIITLDADELIEPTYFEVLYWALYYNPDCAWAYTDNLGFQAQEYLWSPPFDAERLKTYNFLVESAAIRKKDLLEVGCYDEVEKHYYEDWRLWLKLLSKSKRPVHVKGYEFWYRRTDSGVLNKIEVDAEIKKRADRLISEVAKTADGTVEAKTFDGKYKKDNFLKPRRTEFKKNYLKEKKKINILFLIPHMIMGGADQFNFDFVRLIDKEKYDVSIITTNPSYNEWKQRFREFTQDIFSLPDFLDTEHYSEFISYIIESRQIDVCLVSNSYYGYYLLPWLRKEYPELALIDYVHMEELYWREGGYARSSAAMGDILEKTYVCNDATKKFFSDYFGRNSKTVETIYIGVDFDKFNPEKEAYGKVRKKYNIENEKKVVLFPCRLHEQKRPYLMIEIARETIKRNADIYFLVVGDGPELAGLKQKSKEYGLGKYVIFTGQQKNLQPYYRDSDLTLICSMKEGLSLTAYESCSMKTPVVTADVGGQKELIDDGVGKVIPFEQYEVGSLPNGYSKKEIDNYVQAILEMLSQENIEQYEVMCENCRKKIIDNFGVNTMIQKMENAINCSLNEERRKERLQKAEILKQLPIMVEEIASVYTAYESRILESEAIWAEKCWLEQMLYKPKISENFFKQKAVWFQYYIKRVYKNSCEFGVWDTVKKIGKKLKIYKTRVTKNI